MKKLLFLLFLIPSFVFGQVALPDGILNQNPVPVDRVSYNVAGTTYTNTAQILSEVPVGKRYAGQLFYVGNPFTLYTFASNADVASGTLTLFLGGSGAYWPLSGSASFTGDVNLNGAIDLNIGQTTPLNNFNMYTSGSAYMEQYGGTGTNQSAISLTDGQATMAVFGSAGNTGGTIGISDVSGIDITSGNSTAVMNVANNGPVLFSTKVTGSVTATSAGFNFGSRSSDPSITVNSDFWYNTSSHKYKGKQNGTVVEFANLTTAQTFNGLMNFAVPNTTFAASSTFPAILIGSVSGDPSSLSNGSLWYNTLTNKIRAYQNGSAVDVIGGGGGSGTVTSVTVNTANGFSGSVSNSTTTPAITLSTPITGILVGDGTSIGSITSGVDIMSINGSSIVGPGDLTVTASTAGLAAVGQVGKSKFDVSGYAIVRMRTNTGSPGGGNLYLTYELLTTADNHDSHFIYSAYPDPSTGKVVINYPFMKSVYRGNVDTDDRLKDFGISVGLGVDVFMMQGYFKFPTSSSALVKLSTVTSTPTAISGLTPITNISVSSGIFTITGGAQWYQNHGAVLVKPGLKNGVAIFNNEDNAVNQNYETKFSLRDALGNKITSFDSNNDGDFMWVVLPSTIQKLDARYYNSAFWPDDIGFEATAVALFCEVSGEAYLISSPVSSTSTLSEWQAYPSATDYQLYRSLKSASSVDLTTGVITFGTETQVYTGTGFSFQDSGLSANTVYYYHLKGTVGGVPDTDITFFDVKTNP